eukprot:scaffold313949_cov18-Tisochrysis_lutea.AAC.1
MSSKRRAAMCTSRALALAQCWSGRHGNRAGAGGGVRVWRQVLGKEGLESVLAPAGWSSTNM